MAKKTYTIIKYRRFGGTREISGTIEELVEYFGNTLSWWEKTTPKTIVGLVNALNTCVNRQQGACYHRDYYELKQ